MYSPLILFGYWTLNKHYYYYKMINDNNRLIYKHEIIINDIHGNKLNNENRHVDKEQK